MGALAIVIGADGATRMIEIEEQRLVEKFVAHAPVEAFAKAVLHGLVWRDEVPVDTCLLGPGKHGVAAELAALVADNQAGLAPGSDEGGGQFARNAPARDRGVGDG